MVLWHLTGTQTHTLHVCVGQSGPNNTAQGAQHESTCQTGHFIPGGRREPGDTATVLTLTTLRRRAEGWKLWAEGAVLKAPL